MFGEIFTLQEFVTSTEAISYLIAGAYLIAFPAFWKFLVARDKEE